MSKALIVGSVALDTIETPHGRVEAALGGSAAYGSVAASYFTDVALVGVVGEDFNPAHIRNFQSRGIDLSGLEHAKGKTFHWSGYYRREMNQAITNTTELNVFADFKPRLSDAHANIPFLFLANIHPALQLDALNKVHKPRLVAVDTMNFWIEGEKQRLTEIIRRADILLVNEEEARQYCEKVNLIECGRTLARLGPRTVVIKKGEHGSMLFQKDRIVVLPAFPLENVKDPTGAGDTFAGAMVGYLARLDSVGDDDIVRAILVGTCMASFVVEEFSIGRTIAIKPGELKARVDYLRGMVQLPSLAEETLIDSKRPG